ncbi:MAG: hypothetical protein J5I87_06665 [Nitrosomonas nitrosa]|nr:hypothetical protein [Nitrosomonas nitrosa]
MELNPTKGKEINKTRPCIVIYLPMNCLPCQQF